MLIANELRLYVIDFLLKKYYYLSFESSYSQIMSCVRIGNSLVERKQHLLLIWVEVNELIEIYGHMHISIYTHVYYMQDSGIHLDIVVIILWSWILTLGTCNVIFGFTWYILELRVFFDLIDPTMKSKRGNT